MRASYRGVDMEGTPEEIAKYVQKIKEQYYGKVAQIELFNKQEAKVWLEA